MWAKLKGKKKIVAGLDDPNAFFEPIKRYRLPGWELVALKAFREGNRKLLEDKFGWSSLDGKFPEPELCEHLLLLREDIDEGKKVRRSYAVRGLVFLELRTPLLGPLAPEIGGFQKLTQINLTGNRIDGKLPDTLGDLVSLEILILARNRIEGEIPENLGLLKKLKTLDLSSNIMVGGFPPSLCECKSLEVLRLQNNRFEGPIPKELGKLTAAKTIAIQQNFFSGHMPTSIGQMQNLQAFYLNNNDIHGVIPSSILLCTKLTALTLAHTKVQLPLKDEYAHEHAANIQEICATLPRSQHQPAVDGSSVASLGNAEHAHSFAERLERFTEQHGPGPYQPETTIFDHRHEETDPTDPMKGQGHTLKFTVVATSALALGPIETCQKLKSEYGMLKRGWSKDAGQQEELKVQKQQADLHQRKESHKHHIWQQRDTGALEYTRKMPDGARTRTWPEGANVHYPTFLHQEPNKVQARCTNLQLEGELQDHLDLLISRANAQQALQAEIAAKVTLPFVQRRRQCLRVVKDFKKMDSDCDGFVTEEDQIQHWVSVLPGLDSNNLTDQVKTEMTARFTALDTDQDGKVSIDDMMRGMDLIDTWTEMLAQERDSI